jgi:hypothetical protein
MKKIGISLQDIRHENDVPLKPVNLDIKALEDH